MAAGAPPSQRASQNRGGVTHQEEHYVLGAVNWPRFLVRHSANLGYMVFESRQRCETAPYRLHNTRESRYLGAMSSHTSLLSSVGLIALFLVTPAFALDRQPIVGQASVIDGDTIEIHGQRIRFHGIDAPESRQLCDDARGKPYRCGQKAALALSDKIDRRTVHCEPKDIDRYKRVVAVCRIDTTDLNGWLVREGLAIAYRQYSHDYVSSEAAARQARRGLWAGRFIEPAKWRKAQRD